MASRSMIMEPITDCSASMLWGSTLFKTASSIDAIVSFSFFHFNLQRTDHLRMQLHRHIIGTKCPDGVV